MIVACSRLMAYIMVVVIVTECGCNIEVEQKGFSDDVDVQCEGKREGKASGFGA
jgi:hypothetical protein